MADYGIKYAIGSKDVVTNNNPKELGYSSKFNTLKTFLSGFISIAAGASGFTTKEIAHGLSYRPAFNVYFRDPDNGEVYQTEGGFEDVQFNRSGAGVNVHAKSNNYNLILVTYNSAGVTKNIDVFYEIFYEDLVTEPQFFVG